MCILHQKTYYLAALRNASFCQELIALPGTCIKSGHLYQPIANLSFVCFICRNFMPSKILSSDIISCKLLSFTSFCQEQANHSHCQFSCQVCMLTSFCRATTIAEATDAPAITSPSTKSLKSGLSLGFGS